MGNEAKSEWKIFDRRKSILHERGERLMLTKELVENVSREGLKIKLGNQKALIF